MTRRAPASRSIDQATPRGGGGAAHPAFGLQRAAGNRATRQLMRAVELRDVGRGESSGFARADEIVDRMTRLSPSLIFSRDGARIIYEQVAGLTPDSFDRQMMALIDQTAVLPMRLTTRHALLGDRVNGFHDSVDGDAFTSGYVDVDDLLGGSDLGFQMLLLHFLTERAATRNYARRIGTDFSQAEFDRGHALGIEAEAEILRDFFGDTTIRIVNDSPSPSIRRVFRNGRRDLIRRRIRRGVGAAESGIHASFVDVLRRDGTVMTDIEYRDLLQAERDAAAAAAAAGPGPAPVPVPVGP